MSDIVRYRGTLALIASDDNVEIVLERILGEKFPTEPDRVDYYLRGGDYTSVQEVVEAVLYEDFYYDNNSLYRVEKERIDEEMDVFNVWEKSEGYFGFEVMYYNGGCSFNEAIHKSFNPKQDKCK